MYLIARKILLVFFSHVSILLRRLCGASKYLYWTKNLFWCFLNPKIWFLDRSWSNLVCRNILGILYPRISCLILCILQNFRIPSIKTKTKNYNFLKICFINFNIFCSFEIFVKNVFKKKKIFPSYTNPSNITEWLYYGLNH